MILEAEKQSAGGLANDIIRYDITVFPWNILNVGQDGVPFLYDSKEKKRLNSATHGAAEKRWMAHTPVAR